MFNNRRSESPSYTAADARLDAVFHAYRDACPTPEAGTNFMPELWARIEATRLERRQSASIFSQTVRFLVTAAIAATVLFGIMLGMEKQPGNVSPGVYMEALVTDGEAALDLLNPENMTEMEQQ